MKVFHAEDGTRHAIDLDTVAAVLPNGPAGMMHIVFKHVDVAIGGNTNRKALPEILVPHDVGAMVLDHLDQQTA